VHQLTCRWEAEGCTRTLSRAHLVVHETSACLFRARTCDDCQQLVRVSTFASHKANARLPCKGMKTCPNGCDGSSVSVARPLFLVSAKAAKKHQRRKAARRAAAAAATVATRERPVVADLVVATAADPTGTMRVGKVLFYTPDALVQHCATTCTKRRETCNVCRTPHLVLERAAHKQSVAHVEALEARLLELGAHVDFQTPKPLPDAYEMEQLFRAPIATEQLLFSTRAHLATFECAAMSDPAWLRVRVGKPAHSQNLCLRIDVCPKDGATSDDSEPSRLAYARELSIYLHPFKTAQQLADTPPATAIDETLMGEVRLLDVGSYLVRVPALPCKTEPHDATEEDSETTERAW
jgi:hypothetical protein